VDRAMKFCLVADRTQFDLHHGHIWFDDGKVGLDHSDIGSEVRYVWILYDRGMEDAFRILRARSFNILKR
jgi:hypothetical protein